MCGCTFLTSNIWITRDLNGKTDFLCMHSDLSEVKVQYHEDKLPEIRKQAQPEGGSRCSFYPDRKMFCFHSEWEAELFATTAKETWVCLICGTTVATRKWHSGDTLQCMSHKPPCQLPTWHTSRKSLWGSFEQTCEFFEGQENQPTSTYQKTKEPTVDFRKAPNMSDATNIKVEYVQPYKYLETTVDSRLNFDINCEALWKKCLRVCFT